MKEFEDVSIRWKIDVEIPEHQVLLNFANDDKAATFESWLEQIGMKEFAKWLEENIDNY